MGWTCVGCKYSSHPFGANKHEQWEYPCLQKGNCSLGSLLQPTELHTHNHCCLCTSWYMRVCFDFLAPLTIALGWHTGRTSHCPVLIQWCLSLWPCWWSLALWCSGPFPCTVTGNTDPFPRGFLKAQHTARCACVHVGVCIHALTHRHVPTFPYKSPKKLNIW